MTKKSNNSSTISEMPYNDLENLIYLGDESAINELIRRGKVLKDGTAQNIIAYYLNGVCCEVEPEEVLRFSNASIKNIILEVIGKKPETGPKRSMNNN